MTDAERLWAGGTATGCVVALFVAESLGGSPRDAFLAAMAWMALAFLFGAVICAIERER